jgi:hypothetical protein
MTNQQKAIAAAAVVILMGASFWGGMAYAKHASPMRGNFQFGMGNSTFVRGGAGGFSGPGMGGRTAGSITSGQVLSQDASSITLKLMDGGTKIVLLSASTTVSKTEQGSASDLAPGTNVFVTGTPNSDGSITAQTVQLRPAGEPGARPVTP